MADSEDIKLSLIHPGLNWASIIDTILPSQLSIISRTSICTYPPVTVFIIHLTLLLIFLELYNLILISSILYIAHSARLVELWKLTQKKS